MYQPTCQLGTGEILGYEALVRNKSQNKLSPLDIFKQADYSIIILEGIETEEDLKIAKQSGISYAQGYLLGRTSPWKSLSVQNYNIGDYGENGCLEKNR